MLLEVCATSSFDRVVKKLHTKEKKIVDAEIAAVVENLTLGQEKKGDLLGVFVHKFKLNRQEMLLAYELLPNKLKPKKLILLALGPHENFYLTLKR
ncbi:MAG: type II toxin-antitoxin system RelE/ParE family toxin [Rhizobacter sp.]|nr:type II toxin-antitoxin system RelE/ParE family toxin [Burkholderiales bacterium]